MTEIILAVLPIFLLILAGHATVRTGFLSRGFWADAERFTYFVLFPCLLLGSVAKAELGTLALGPMAFAVVGAMLAISAILLAIRPRLPISGASFTSVYQGCLRMNTYLALAVAFALRGQAGVDATAVAIAIFVPLANLLCVSVLVRYAAATPGSVGRTLLAIAKNPLILAILGGILLNVTGVGLPPVVGPMLEILGRAALGLGLLAVGAGLDFRAAREAGPVVLGTSALKLLVMPLFAAGLAWALQLTGDGRFAAVLLHAMPTAGAAYILARQLGGDATLMASIITVETGLAMVTLPIMLGLLG